MKNSPKKGEKEKREAKGLFQLINSLWVAITIFMLSLARIICNQNYVNFKFIHINWRFNERISYHNAAKSITIWYKMASEKISEKNMIWSDVR